MIPNNAAIKATKQRLSKAALPLIVAKAVNECPCSKQDIYTVMQTIDELADYSLAHVYRALIELYDYGVIERISTAKPNAVGPKPTDYFRASKKDTFPTKGYILAVEKFLILPNELDLAVTQLTAKLKLHMDATIKQLPLLTAG